jgi:Flp pilus assembly protein TadG
MSEGSRQSLSGTSGKPRRKRSSQSTRRGSNQLVTETPSLWLKIARLVRREDGGAIVEFVALAIPLFIPIFIYLNSFSSVSANEVIAQGVCNQ